MEIIPWAKHSTREWKISPTTAMEIIPWVCTLLESEGMKKNSHSTSGCTLLESATAQKRAWKVILGRRIAAFIVAMGSHCRAMFLCACAMLTRA